MAKAKTTHQNLTRRQLARHERDKQQQKILIWIAATVGVVIVAITLFGIITESSKAKQPVASVGEVTITKTEYKTRQYYERWMARLQVYSYQQLLNQYQAQVTPEPDSGVDTPITASEDAYVQQLQLTINNIESQLSVDLSSLFASQVLDTMIEEELVRQEADVRGLTVDEADVDIAIEQFMGFDTTGSTVSPTVTDTLTTTVATPDPQEIEDTFNQFKTNVLEPSRFTEDDFRTMVRTGLLKEQLKTILGETVPLVEDQVQITLLAIPTEEAGSAITARINLDAEDPAAIVTELNEDDDDISYGYEVPWLPIGYLGNQISVDIERVAFNTPVGKASEPVPGPDEIFYVIYVNGHEEQPLAESILSQTREQAYNDWLLAQTDENADYLDWEDAVLTQP